MRKIGFTHVSLDTKGYIGILTADKTLRDEPEFFRSETKAIEFIVSHHLKQPGPTIIMCDTCFTYRSRRAGFDPRIFKEQCVQGIKNGRQTEHHSTGSP